MTGKLRNLPAPHTYFAVISQNSVGSGFYDDACKDFYLRRLLHCHRSFQIRLHAYLLLDDKILLMITTLTPNGFDSFVRFLNRAYNNYYGARFERRTEPWKNRALLSGLPMGNLILDVQKFIERFSLGLEDSYHPGEIPYSSYCANAFSVYPQHLQRHPAFLERLTSGVSMLSAYREFIAAPFRGEYERFLQSRLLEGRSLSKPGSSRRLEKNRVLTDIDKSGTIAAIVRQAEEC